MDPRPSITDLGVIYPAHYYSYSMSDKLSWIALKGKEILDRIKLKGILRHCASQVGSYLDVGCGDGRYLRAMEQYCGLTRANLYGLELSADTAGKLHRQGFSVFNERVETCTGIAKGSISMITMFHVIEHVADPCATIAQIAEWLEPGGALAIETPNINSIDARLFRRSLWGGYHFPRHWHLFNEKTLTDLMLRCGLRVVDVSYQTGHSFWMYSFHHWLRYRLNLKRLSEFFDPMQGLAFLLVFTGIDKLRSLIGLKTSSILIVGRKEMR